MSDIDPYKAVLIAEIEAARAKVAVTGAALQAAGEGMRKSFDIPARARASFEKHRPAWLGGAALVGLLLSKIPARKKTIFVETASGVVMGNAGKIGKVVGLLKFAGKMARPFLGDLAAKWVASRVAKPEAAAPDDPAADI